MPRETQNRSCASSSTRTSCAWRATRSTSTCGSCSSSSRDLPAEIAAGRLREDLFHRLSVVPVRVPSLSERREDVPELIAFFMDQISAATGPAEAHHRRRRHGRAADP
jgi:two-component system nitrogen regulation response regulator NtrX